MVTGALQSLRNIMRVSINTTAAAILLAYAMALVPVENLCANQNDGENAEEKARQLFVQRYLEFTGDKNVMGKAKSTDGKIQLTGNKTRFDNDDGLSYRSDLTYHDLSFTSPDEGAQKAAESSKDPKVKAQAVRDLLPFVSPHGGLSEAGGSSQLERTMYQKFDEFSKKDAETKEEKKKQDEEKGIKYKGVFKVTTKEIFEDPQANGAPKDANAKPGANPTADPANQEKDKKEKEKDKVERVELRPEVRDAVVKVGENSEQSIERAAKDKEDQEDPNALPNSTLMYDAAGRATTALWNSTMANLYQRRLFKGLEGDPFPPKLSEDMPDCKAWEADARKEMAKLGPEERKQREKDFEVAKKGCTQMSQMPFTAIDPRYEPLPNDPKTEILKERGPKKEDPFARDLRNQLEIMSSAGKKLSDVQSNWKYDENDERVEVSIGIDETANLTVGEQLDQYNQQLDKAKEGFQGVKERAPQLDVDQEQLDKFRIEPETRSVMDINRAAPQALEEFGVDPNKIADPQAAQNYEQLIENAQK